MRARPHPSPGPSRLITRPVRRAVAGLVSLSLAGAVLPALLTAPAGAAETDLASGDDWTVERAAGGFLVTVELDEPLAIRSDAPTIEVDGASIGVATEAEDGGSLEVFTSDRSVLAASTVEPGWSSTPDGPATARAARTAVDVPARETARLAADPGEIGDSQWSESIYKFGDQAIDLAGIGGVRGELEGKLYLPDDAGERPTVLLLHGRHSFCYGPAPSNPGRWPCAPQQTSIPSYLGYDGTARALASHGYSVVSVSANAVNANDNQLAPDLGARARGRLLLDTLAMLEDANAGRSVSFTDRASEREVDLAQALRDGTTALAERAEGFLEGVDPLDDVTPADLVGRFDLDRVGMMGHSRGGEGVTAAATLNNAAEERYGLQTILPLAPVDFGRMTVPDVAMNVMLPYCDGDVSNQQGQHMLDDSRYAFDDDVLRSGVWAMGANHNFYNTVWTPGLYAFNVTDDWSGSATRRVEPTCGTDPTVAGTSIRMTAQEQYDQGTAYMAGWFRLTLGGEEEFLPMFDGSGEVPEALGEEDIRSVSTAPASSRRTLSTFEDPDSLVGAVGGATVTPCASLSGRTTVQTRPACATTLASSQAPHWTPASIGGNVPATPMSRLSWSDVDQGLRVTLPRRARDASGFERLSAKLAADESVVTATDLQMAVVDGSGARWTGLVSELNPLALVRLPSSETTVSATLLKKVVLQQVDVPIATLEEAGLDVSDLRQVRLTGAPVPDGAPDDTPDTADTAGAAYVSDLALESSSVGTPDVGPEPALNVYAPSVDEGDAPGTADVALYLDAPADAPVVGFVSVIGSSTSRAGATMERVVVPAGTTCVPVTATLQGDTLPGTTSTSTVRAGVANTSGAVMGADAIGLMRVREDDGVSPPATGLPAFGNPDDVCAELATLDRPGVLEVAADTVAPGEDVVMTASGYRPGESVSFAADGIEPLAAVADADGIATVTLTVPADAVRGPVAVTATGAATGIVAETTFSVLDGTSVVLELLSEQIAIGQPVDFRVSVAATGAGADLDGPVQILANGEPVAAGEAVDGIADITVPGFGAGTQRVTAVFGPTATAASSTSAPVVIVLTRRSSSVSFGLSANRSPFGAGSTGTVRVSGPDGEPVTGGRVEWTAGERRGTVDLDETGMAQFALPARLAVGRYRVGVRFLGTDLVAPSGLLTTRYVVEQAETRTRLRVPGQVAGGAPYAVTAVVSVPEAQDTAPRGAVQLQVAFGNGPFRTARRGQLGAGDAGQLTWLLRAPQRGTVRVRAVYEPGSGYGGSRSAVSRIRVQ